MKPGFDYIIVGGGSAGSVLANRLSADPKTRVLLLEAGPSDRNPLYRVPMMAGRLFLWKYNNWAYSTEPEPHLKGRRIFWPRGRVLGGSSSINGMIYARGNRLDYDNWAQMGLHAWSYDRVLPYFKKSERHFNGGGDYHGGDGELPVTRINTGHPMFNSFIEGAQQAGHPFNPDFNGEKQEGVGLYDYNIFEGQRWSAARSFLRPIRKSRPNLVIETGAHLQRIEIDRTRATGVLVKIGTQTYGFTAEREVILSCGSINSPMALMHSGTGEPSALYDLGIPVVHELEGVGRNLQDHLNVSIVHRSPVPDLTYDFRRLDRAVVGVVAAAFLKRGRATYFPHEGGAFLRSSSSVEAPDLQIHFVASGGSRSALRHPLSRPAPNDGYGYTAHVCQLRPESTGRVSLRSNDPAAAPVIQANYLSTETDRRVMRDGFRLTRDILRQPAFDAIRGPQLTPDRALDTDAEIDDWIASSASTIFHPVGTCRMGLDDMAVVDEQLRVRGLEGLRVVDASIMPKLVSANTHAPTVMIAERAADFILNG